MSIAHSFDRTTWDRTGSLGRVGQTPDGATMTVTLTDARRATFEDAIKKLAMEFMKDPREVQIAGRNTVAEMVTHIAHPVDSARKRDLLQRR